MALKVKNLGLYVLGFVLYALFLALLLFLFADDIKENFSSHDYIARLNEYKSIIMAEEEGTYPAVLYSIEGPVLTKESIRKGFRDDEHLTIEALLNAPSSENISHGLISYINSDTRLIGITVDQDKELAYISLSDDFLSSSDIEKAKTQIEETLKAQYGSLRVAIIVDGEII